MSLSSVGRHRSLVYLSTAAPGLTDDTVDAITEQATVRNRELELTGFLIYRSNRFVQYLEGPAGNLELLYDRIASDDRHRIEVRTDVTVVGRRFVDWGMRLLDPMWLPSMSAYEALHELLTFSAAVEPAVLSREVASIVDRLALDAATA